MSDPPALKEAATIKVENETEQKKKKKLFSKAVLLTQILNANVAHAI